MSSLVQYRGRAEVHPSSCKPKVYETLHYVRYRPHDTVPDRGSVIDHPSRHGLGWEMGFSTISSAIMRGVIQVSLTMTGSLPGLQVDLLTDVLGVATVPGVVHSDHAQGQRSHAAAICRPISKQCAISCTSIFQDVRRGGYL